MQFLLLLENLEAIVTGFFIGPVSVLLCLKEWKDQGEAERKEWQSMEWIEYTHHLSAQFSSMGVVHGTPKQLQ
jgi:hypothetical protein